MPLISSFLWCQLSVHIVSAPGRAGWWRCVLTTWHHVSWQFCRREEGCILGLFSPPLSIFWSFSGKRTSSEWKKLFCHRVGSGGEANAPYWSMPSRRWRGWWKSVQCIDGASWTNIGIGAHERQLFDKLRWWLVTSTILSVVSVW